MNSRLIRVFLVVVAIAIGVTAGYFLKTTESNMAGSREASNTLRDQRDGLLATLADVRAAQVAYVARGQGEAFWMSRVAKLLPALEQQMTDFKSSLSSPTAQTDLEPAADAIEHFHKLDARAQDYVKSSDPLLASDLIFSDGLGAIATAMAQVQMSFRDELQARDANAAGLRIRELVILGGGAGGVLLILLMLGFSGGATLPRAAQAS